MQAGRPVTILNEPGPGVVTDLADDVMFTNPFPTYATLRRRAGVAPARSRQLLGGEG